MTSTSKILGRIFCCGVGRVLEEGVRWVEGIGVTPSWPMKASSGVRLHPCMTEGTRGDDRQTNTQSVHYMMMRI